MAKIKFRASRETNCHCIEVPVDPNHPLLILKDALPWQRLYDIALSAWRQAGKNLDGHRGRKWDVWLYLRILIIMITLGLQSRQMEQKLAENAVIRTFVECQDHHLPQIRDHANIARANESLGVEAKQQFNDIILKTATQVGFADISEVSGDTTVQEVPIGYPNEPGILKSLAERCQRAFTRLKAKGALITNAAISKAQEVIASAKEYHLFAQDRETKEETLGQMLEQVVELQDRSIEVIDSLKESTDRTVASARQKLAEMHDVASTLVSQIIHWLSTGTVAKDKILHPEITQAKAIVKNKAGKKVEFGFKYLIGRIGGGYLFSKLLLGNPSEHTMPRHILQEYQRIFGSEAVPDIEIYDRGGYCEQTIDWLQDQGVSKIGIQPKGKKPWLVDNKDQIKKARARTEGDIGSLKSAKYGFNLPKERNWPNLQASGVTCILSQNLNRLMRDLTKQNARPAAVLS